MNDVKDLYATYEKHIFIYLYRLTFDYHLAEDLTQETFFRVVKSFMRFRGDSNVTTWLYKIARNVYYEWSRKNNLKTVDIDSMQITDYEDPQSLYEKKEKDREINKAFKNLPEKYREVLWLREWQGMTYEEIAIITDHSLDWVKVNIYRARRAFRENYKGKGGPDYE